MANARTHKTHAGHNTPRGQPPLESNFPMAFTRRHTGQLKVSAAAARNDLAKGSEVRPARNES